MRRLKTGAFLVVVALLPANIAIAADFIAPIRWLWAGIIAVGGIVTGGLAESEASKSIYSATAISRSTGAVGEYRFALSAEEALNGAIAECIDRGGVTYECRDTAELR